MALHTETTIHKTAYDLFDAVMDLVKNMPRDFKQSLGSKLRDECIAITVLVFRANTYRDKEPHILSLIERVQVIELMLRLSRDKRLISTGHYAAAIQLTNSIGKQANGWRKWATSSAS
ncbi:hypothetical protein GALL_71770 [mine drainage metagenome]|uniref:bAvd-like domain-containing protein n=1 Tax=mine drainage metagenome TaxID=410659 RepID=A0A1J5TG59_9ZZZZ